jgi:hypothetical protein
LVGSGFIYGWFRDYLYRLIYIYDVCEGLHNWSMRNKKRGKSRNAEKQKNREAKKQGKAAAAQHRSLKSRNAGKSRKAEKQRGSTRQRSKAL